MDTKRKYAKERSKINYQPYITIFYGNFEWNTKETERSIAEYSGDQAYKRSVKTYGGEGSSFLTPGTATTTANNGSAGETETPPSSSDSDLGS